MLTTTFFQFCNVNSGILLYTVVAARGRNIPENDWTGQYDVSDDPKEYILHVSKKSEY